MRELYQNNELSYEKNAYAERNVFLTEKWDSASIPKYEDVAQKLPMPIFDGHSDYIACYDYAWKTAFGNLFQPTEESGFISNFIDTAFNGCLFMWDSCFILMFAKYAARLFPFQNTLDNFYAKQHRDGFICREIRESNGRDRFARHDPASTGPNVMPWCEMNYFETFGDKDRLAKIYDPLRAYHIWMRKNRTWRDGSYYSSGWGCGMDNCPRLAPEYNQRYSHGHMVWIDACCQQILSANILIKMNRILGEKDDVSDLIEERDRLILLVNEKMWDSETGFYFDLRRDNSFNGVKHIGAYWALLAGIVPQERANRFVAHLCDPKEFNRPNTIPALSADHPEYHPKDGGYWRGGVWSPTNYMTLCGLSGYGCDDLAYTIADRYVKNVVNNFSRTGTLWENYAPESDEKGNPARPDFVGWTGLAPISIFFEYVLGIRADVPANTVYWNVNKTDRHGIFQYPFGTDITMDLVCEARESADEEPMITATSNKPVTILVRWNGKEKTIHSCKSDTQGV